MQDILWLRSCIELDSFLLEAKVGLWRSKYDATPEFRFKNYDGRMCEKTTFQTVQFYCKNIHPTLFHEIMILPIVIKVIEPFVVTTKICIKTSVECPSQFYIYFILDIKKE